jgi:hypothetical protein
VGDREVDRALVRVGVLPGHQQDVIQWQSGIHNYLMVTLWMAERETAPTLTVAGAGVAQVIDYAPGSNLGPRRLIDYEFVWIPQRFCDVDPSPRRRRLAWHGSPQDNAVATPRFREFARPHRA